MDVSRIIALIVFLFPLAYSPGPGNAFFASIGASQGLRGAIQSLLGYHVATFIVTALLGLGFDAAFLANAGIMRVVSAAGGVYVLWIGWQFLRAAWASTDKAGPAGAAAGVSFIDGALVLLLNPKAYVIIGLMFTQFLTPGSDGLSQVFAVTTIFTLNNLLAFVVWTVAGMAIAALLRGETAHRNLNVIFGLSMLGVGVWMLMPVLHI